METMTLPCQLTSTELDERRDKLVALVAKADALEDEKKMQATAIKGKIETVESEMRDLAYEIRTRKQQRPVEIKRDKDLIRGVEEIIRLDTGEVVETRHLSPHERQGELKLLNGQVEKHRRIKDQLEKVSEG